MKNYCPKCRYFFGTTKAGKCPDCYVPLENAPQDPSVPLPCPFCGEAPRVVDDYDSRSGWGQKENGWIACRCGASMAAPSPSSPYPTIPKPDVIAAWNLRHNARAMPPAKDQANEK